MFYYYGTVIFIFGLVFGSFLNCVGMRIALKEDWVHGRSRCRGCGHELGPADLVPVASWVFSGGKCRYCHEKISARYPATELLFALLCLGLYLKYGLGAELARDLVLVGCLFTLSIVDLECFEIPDGCLLIGLAAWGISAPFMHVDFAYVLHHLLAGLICGGAMLFISLLLDRILGKESLGGGDIKLFALLGLYFGYVQGYFLIMLSCVIGLIFGAITKHMASAKDDPDNPGAFPLGPAISVAAYIMLMCGKELADWYLSISGL